ncbi:MAG: thiamine pyrophosphate-dependent enzyme, partial [Plesiomonas shigelloides]
QEVDVLGLSLACTKHSFLVRRPEELTSVLAEAFRVASSGRPGPVLVDIPKDIQLMAIRPQPLAVADVPQPSCPPSALAQAQQLLQAAQRPMLYVGGGVALAGASAQLNALLRHSAMPSVVTLKGLGAVDPHHPYYLGMLGMHGSKAANLAVQQCDLLLVVGARFDDRVTGKLDTFAPDAKVIHLDIDSAEFGKLRRPDVALHGDLRALLPALSAALTAPFSIAPWLAQIDALNAEHAWDYAAAEHSERIDAPALLRTLSQRRPRTSVVTTDVGQHQMWVAQHMQFTSPHDLLTSAGLGTMGFGLPAAVGAQMARPQDCVICVSGDGSFMMNVQELGTLKRRRLPVKIVLLDNQRLGMVRQWQSLFFAGRFSETDLSDNPDFLTLASAFGIPGQQIWRQDQVADALETMLASPGPYLLHVRINEQDNVWPLVPPGAGNDTMLEAL